MFNTMVNKLLIYCICLITPLIRPYILGCSNVRRMGHLVLRTWTFAAGVVHQWGGVTPISIRGAGWGRFHFSPHHGKGDDRLNREFRE